MGWDENKHPRGEGGKFSDHGNYPSQRTGIVVARRGGAGPEKEPTRSLARGSSAWRIGASTSSIPAGYTGSTVKEHQAGTMLAHSFQTQFPASYSPEKSESLLKGLVDVVRGHRAGTIDRGQTDVRLGRLYHGKREPLIPAGTPRGTVVGAYAHASKLALKKFGVAKYDFTMDPHLRAEMTPLTHFIRYAARRLHDQMTATHPGVRADFVKAFGKPFKDQRLDRHTGAVRLRLPGNEVLVNGPKMTREGKEPGAPVLGVHRAGYMAPDRAVQSLNQAHRAG